jgi:hypothetical protein
MLGLLGAGCVEDGHESLTFDGGLEDPALANLSDTEEFDTSSEVPHDDTATYALVGVAATGLCLDSACKQISSNAKPFMPRWQLYTDGAVKRRWIYIPAGKRIDTTNQDDWRFPVGTKVWKEFVRGGKKVETRYMVKTGTDDAAWTMITYAWNAAQTESRAAPAEGVQNALGTPHDIPPRTACVQCHGNNRGRVLGFSAFQLDYAATAPNIDIDDARDRGWLTAAPTGASPHWPLPGTSTARAALGYLHANCGHCHNSNSSLINRPMLKIEMGYTSTIQSTRMYRSTVNVTGTTFEGASLVVKPRYPDQSILVKRMATSDTRKRMPYLGVEVPDPTGASIVRQWISSL